MNLRQELHHDAATPATVDVRGDGRGPQRSPAQGDRPPDGRRTLVSRFKEQPLLNSLLLLACIALIIVGVTALGPSSSSGGQLTRTATAKNGVVQSTVSGSGNVQSADQLDLGFKTSGTVTNIYVKQGQHVAEGQLLATLDPQSAEVSLEQAKASLQAAEANLAKEEEDEGETSSGQGASGSGATASTSSVSYTTSSPAPAGTTPTNTTTTTAPKKSAEHSESQGANSNAGSSQAAESANTPASTSSSTKQSAATREANLASAKADVKSDKLAVQSAEQAVENTKLRAPQSGTIVTLSGEVGETVSGTGTSKAASSSSSSSSNGSSSGSGGKSPTGASSATDSSSSASDSSSSSSFAVLSNLESLQLVVSLSESEIGSVHEGQIATVTIEPLNRKVAAHVASVSQVPTSSSGAVSYDVTFQLDQGAEGLKVGMSATAEVVVSQAEGVNVPTSAIKAGSVTVVRGGKHVTQRVTTGLAGDSSTIVTSGLAAGEVVVLPTLSTSGGASLTSRLSSRLGSRTGGIGGGGFAGGGAFPGGPPGG